MSKKDTADYLRRHFKDDVSLQKIYRYMDKLYNTQRERVQEISVRHARQLFGGNIGILFYDVTTLYFETTDKDGNRLIVGYSEERARKNQHDRDEGIERLRKRYAKGTLTKADINKRGYNKFLSISSGVTVRIDESKIEEDKVWDGLKGYRTNTDLPAELVYENYQQLWNVERAFRITKGTLDVRPMFHFTERRIEAHVCICFVALKVNKELEILLKVSRCPYSVNNVLRIAEVIVTLEINLPENRQTMTRTLYTSKEERDIAYLIETDDWLMSNG